MHIAFINIIAWIEYCITDHTHTVLDHILYMLARHTSARYAVCMTHICACALCGEGMLLTFNAALNGGYESCIAARARAFRTEQCRTMCMRSLCMYLCWLIFFSNKLCILVCSTQRGFIALCTLTINSPTNNTVFFWNTHTSIFIYPNFCNPRKSHTHTPPEMLLHRVVRRYTPRVTHPYAPNCDVQMRCATRPQLKQSPAGRGTVLSSRCALVTRRVLRACAHALQLSTELNILILGARRWFGGSRMNAVGAL